MKFQQIARATSVVLAAILLVGLVQNNSSADVNNSSESSASSNNSNSGNDVQNIREDRHESRSNPDLITGSVEKMPIRSAAGTPKTTATVSNVTYHNNAPVMINPKVNVLWYGPEWVDPCNVGAANSTPGIVTNLLQNIGGSDWYGTNTLYYSQVSSSASRNYVTPAVAYGNCAFDTGTVGTSLDIPATTQSVKTTKKTTAKYNSGVTSIALVDTTNLFIGDGVTATGIPTGTSVSNISGTTITLSKATTGSISSGATLSFTHISILSPGTASTGDVVKSAISRGLFGSTSVDPNALYFILTSPSISVSGFIVTFCGYHGYDIPTGLTYSFVGDPTKNIASGLSSCSGQTIASPNGNVAADSMSSVIAHELVEAVSDPQVNAWYDSSGNENADKCAWNFMTVGGSADTGFYNTAIGGKNYYIQANWNPLSVGCALKLPLALAATSSITGTKILEVGKSTASFIPVVGSSGYPTYRYSVAGLPAGLTMNATTGAITGTPTASIAQTSLTVQVTDAQNNVARASFNLLVSPALTLISLFPPTASAKSLALNQAVTNLPIVTAGGSTATPITYAVASGSLPTGITLSPTTGQISGTPTAKKTATAVGVKATDAAGATITVTVYLSVA